MAGIVGVVLEAMRRLIGDPRVHLHAGLGRKNLSEMYGPFKRGPYGYSAYKRASEVVSTDAIGQLPAEFCESMSARCYRGQKQDRHTIWTFQITAPGGYIRSTELELLVDRVQLEAASESGMGDVSDLLLPLFRACTAEATFTHGYAELRRRDESAEFWKWPMFGKHQSRATYAVTPLSVLRTAADLCWFCHQSDRRLVVPGVYWVNVLSAAQVDALGGPDRLAESIQLPYLDGDLLQLSPVLLSRGSHLIGLTPLQTDCLIDHRQVHMCSNAALLLTHLAQAGLLAFQNGRWINEVEEWERARRAEAESITVTSGHRPDITIEQLRALRPRCIAQNCKPVVGAAFDALIEQHHEFISAFAIVSANGGQALTIAGVKSDGAEGLASPIIVGGTSPARAALSFDQRCHGWEGEQIGGEPNLRNRRLSQLSCNECKGRLFEAVAVFEYPDDLGDTLDKAELEHAQDFFTWLWLRARCASCGQEFEAADIECA